MLMAPKVPQVRMVLTELRVPKAPPVLMALTELKVLKVPLVLMVLMGMTEPGVPGVSRVLKVPQVALLRLSCGPVAVAPPESRSLPSCRGPGIGMG